MWGDVDSAGRSEENPGVVRPCSSVLDVGDAVTAVSFNSVTSLDGRYVIS